MQTHSFHTINAQNQETDAKKPLKSKKVSLLYYFIGCVIPIGKCPPSNRDTPKSAVFPLGAATLKDVRGKWSANRPERKNQSDWLFKCKSLNSYHNDLTGSTFSNAPYKAQFNAPSRPHPGWALFCLPPCLSASMFVYATVDLRCCLPAPVNITDSKGANHYPSSRSYPQ